MNIELTPEQYGTVARALVVIAAGKRFVPGGQTKTVSRTEMIALARKAAATIKLNYLGDGLGRSSFPEEIGLQFRRSLTTEPTP